MPPARLSKTDSIRIIRTMPRRRQPMARRMPISCVRSKTDTTIVFNMPSAPMMMAMAEVIQDMALMKRISVVDVTESSAVLASMFGPSVSMAARIRSTSAGVVGLIDHHGVAGHLALAGHELLQGGQRHPHAARLVGNGALDDSNHCVCPVVEQR